MSDYINFIDFNSIKLANLAYEIGDYRCASQNYSKVLNRLREYQGDSIQPIMMASEIVEKIDNIITKINGSRDILRFDVWKLTKSSFVKGNQCLKYLYLDRYKKEEKTPISKEKQELFKQGHSFEELVRVNEFPNGINIKEIVSNFAYFNSYTRYLLSSKSKQILYEATIIEKEVLVMCDILVKNENNDIHIYEIKLNTECNEAIINDLSVQYTICKNRFQTNLKSFNLILRSEDKSEKWKIINLTNELDKQMDSVMERITTYKGVLQQDEPFLSMGEHCNKPYECEFIGYCKNKC